MNALVAVIALKRVVETPTPKVRANPLTIDVVNIYKTAAPSKLVT